MFPQSGEGKANKVYKCFSKEIRALSTKGKNKAIKMKGKRWGEMYLFSFNTGVNQKQLQIPVRATPRQEQSGLGGSCQVNAYTICSTSSHVLPGYKPPRSAIYRHGLRVPFRFTEGSLHSSLFGSFS